MIDLATDGVRRIQSRGEVVTAVRSVMLSAYRAGWTWPDVHHLLTDTSRRRLAKQLHTGRGDRPIPAGKVNESLRRWWDDVSSLADAEPAWDRAHALTFVREVRESLDASDVPALDRQVLTIVLDLATEYGTTRVAVPSRTVAERLGISRMRAHRALVRLCETGAWLDLAQRGDQKRANLYRLAPALRTASQPIPAHLPDVANPETNGSNVTGAFLQTPLSEDDHAAVLALLAERRKQAEKPQRPDDHRPANVVTLPSRTINASGT